ncbi:hypothetical protein AM571_CH03150 [Rhizobium etli 8C-3]|uniref:Uncharacterized protein n=1 Tax=Rhizobium etli 8C-3 TaxID=538025 RepID=A0A1L5P755_RHIET|nr:hypothetical protein AM571_CH03150 [Rhizobium etli 8C-3]
MARSMSPICPGNRASHSMRRRTGPVARRRQRRAGEGLALPDLESAWVGRCVPALERFPMKAISSPAAAAPAPVPSRFLKMFSWTTRLFTQVAEVGSAILARPMQHHRMIDVTRQS